MPEDRPGADQPSWLLLIQQLATATPLDDAGPAPGRPGRMRRRFPDAALVVFGHSHIPLDLAGEDGQRLFNPGSPTDRRRQPRGTMGLLRVEGGRLLDAAIVPVT